jgi:hypothetical protein
MDTSKSYFKQPANVKYKHSLTVLVDSQHNTIFKNNSSICTDFPHLSHLQVLPKQKLDELTKQVVTEYLTPLKPEQDRTMEIALHLKTVSNVRGKILKI